MEYVVIAMTGASLAGWNYWKRRERERRQAQDQEYWDEVKRNCATCRVRRRLERELLSAPQQ
jgi:anaerobic selenocysteine-containing dehydrogenase